MQNVMLPLELSGVDDAYSLARESLPAASILRTQ